MTERDDWPLGPALRAARERAGISARKAAERTRGLVSSGRWYQLESGIQKAKGQDVPIGTTAETVVAAALAVGWDVDDALRVAGMTASEATVRAIETKMFGAEVRAPYEEPDWLLYLEALLEYVEHHQELSVGEIAALLTECEYLANNALEAQPALKDGIDRSIAYGSKLNTLLTQLRDKRQQQEHGRKDDYDLAARDAGSSEGRRRREEQDQAAEAADD